MSREFTPKRRPANYDRSLKELPDETGFPDSLSIGLLGFEDHYGEELAAEEEVELDEDDDLEDDFDDGEVVEGDPINDYFFDSYMERSNKSGEIDMYFHFLGNFPLLSEEAERKHLESILATRDPAEIEFFLNSNARLVASIAKRYLGLGFTFMELIQEGNIGMMRCLEKFTFDKGNKFSTYATWWIRQGISRAVHQKGRAVRLPNHRYDLLRKFNKRVGELSSELGRPASIDEIVYRLQIPKKKALALISLNYYEPVSLDDSVSSDPTKDSSIDLVIDPEVDLAGDSESTELQKIMVEALHAMSLTADERRVLELRFGFNQDAHEFRNVYPSRMEIAELLDFGREKVRKLETRGLGKLRRYITEHYGDLKEYI